MLQGLVALVVGLARIAHLAEGVSQFEVIRREGSHAQGPQGWHTLVAYKRRTIGGRTENEVDDETSGKREKNRNQFDYEDFATFNSRLDYFHASGVKSENNASKKKLPLL